MSADDAGSKRSLTPVEAFAAINYDRALLIEKPHGTYYIIQSGTEEYHWLSLNRHGAYCGDWYHDRIDTSDHVKLELKSEHCLNQALEQPSNLKTRVQQLLKPTKNQE